MLVGVALVFEVLGWMFVGQSFLLNRIGWIVMILQMSVIGIIAVGVTQVIITGGIDLSSGSVLALTAMVAASLAQAELVPRRLSGRWRHLGLLADPGRLAIGALVTGVPTALIPTPPSRRSSPRSACTSRRASAKWYLHGSPISMLTEDYAWIGSGRRTGGDLPGRR